MSYTTTDRIKLNIVHKSVFYWFLSQGYDFEYAYSMADLKIDILRGGEA